MCHWQILPSSRSIVEQQKNNCKVMDILCNGEKKINGNQNCILWNETKKPIVPEIAFSGMGQTNQLFQKLYLVEWDNKTQCENQLQKLVGRKTANCKMNGNLQRSKKKQPIVTNVNWKNFGQPIFLVEGTKKTTTCGSWLLTLFFFSLPLCVSLWPFIFLKGFLTFWNVVVFY